MSTTQRILAVLALVVSTTPNVLAASPEEQWRGDLQCGMPLNTSVKSPAFSNPVSMTVIGKKLTVLRDTDAVREELTGNVAVSGAASMAGEGRFKDGHGKPWITKIEGNFSGNSFSGNGAVYFTEGVRWRECKLSLSQVAGEQPKVIETPVAKQPVTSSVKNPIRQEKSQGVAGTGTVPDSKKSAGSTTAEQSAAFPDKVSPTSQSQPEEKPAVNGTQPILPIPKVITAQPDTMASLLEGSIIRGERHFYSVTGKQGQYLSLKIDSVEDNAVLDAYLPGAKPQLDNEVKGILLPGGRETKNVNTQLPADGSYLVVVGGTRGNATYKLNAAITSQAPAAAQPPIIEAKDLAPVPTAPATIPQSTHEATPMASAQGGIATIVVWIAVSIAILGGGSWAFIRRKKNSNQLSSATLNTNATDKLIRKKVQELDAKGELDDSGLLNMSSGMSFPLFFVFQPIGIMPPILAHAEC